MKAITDPRRGFVVALIAALMLLALSGCASMTEEYWQERYAELTPEEIERLKTEGPSSNEYLYRIWLDSVEVATVCIDGDCSTVAVH